MSIRALRVTTSGAARLVRCLLRGFLRRRVRIPLTHRANGAKTNLSATAGRQQQGRAQFGGEVSFEFANHWTKYV